MNHLVRNDVPQDLHNLIPPFLMKEISCFVIYDNHPRSGENIDITICTYRGELKEFYQRELVYSTFLTDCRNAADIHIIRNTKAELFYLIALHGELLVVRRKSKLELFKRITNIEKYEIDDFQCKGQACLKIVCKDDAVPVYFDENFTELKDRNFVQTQENSDDSLPVITQLRRKLNEAKYSVKHNEKAYEELQKIRQLASYHKHEFNTQCERFDMSGGENREKNSPLKLLIKKPLVNLCNKKVVIVLKAVNTSQRLLQDVQILLNTKSNPSLVYTTKIYEAIYTSPFWKENESHQMKHDKEMALVLVIDLKELKHSILDRVEFSGVVAFKEEENLIEYVVSFENVTLTTFDVMGEQFDILSGKCSLAHKDIILAIIATTDKTELCLRHIRNDKDDDIELLDLLCKYLKMEAVTENVIICRISPYHILHGIMMVCHKVRAMKKYINKITFHSRSEPQIFAFMHYMYDSIPYRIVITNCNQTIAAKSKELSEYDETDLSPQIDNMGYKTSVLNQATVLLEYFDKCMIKMNESRDPVVRNKVCSEIDLSADGLHTYLEFKNKILKESFKRTRSENVVQTHMRHESILHDSVPDDIILDSE